MSPSSPRSPQRVGRSAFVVTALGVYFLSFASQVLLTAPVTRHLSVVPFALAQAVLIAVWIVLHRRRLCDAGRPIGIVSVVALIYASEMALLTIAIAVMTWSSGSTAGGVGPDADILQLFVILYLMTLLAGDPSLGALQIWIIGFVVIMLIPIAIALGFSIWAATLVPKVGTAGETL
jgi:hypothetical protein